MEIRELSSLEDIAAARDLILRIWRAPAREEVPAGLFRAMTWHGNPLLGGYVDGKLAGISSAFWGRDDDGTVWLYSSKLGVAEEYRGTGLAEGLKRAQADWTAERGVDEIRWTFDPMRARNARFNFHKLGVTSNTIIEDLLGTRTDVFNAGERTDRLLVRWRPIQPRRDATGDVLNVSLDENAPERGAERDRVRDELRAAFEAGYTAVDFEDGAYVLVR